jgi:hypothetical protein
MTSFFHALKSSDLTAGALVFTLLASALLLGQLNFCRWDNMEVFLPAIWYAHSELLSGRIALWNPFQNLGEPMHAFGNGGALYLPYTISVAIPKLLSLPEAFALDLSAILHAAFGAIGVSKLLSELHVRRSIALAAAVSAMLSGYMLVVGAAWVHVVPNTAWSVWAMWAFWRIVVGGAGARAGVVMAIASLSAVFYTGHVQMAANVWLAVGVWAIGLALALRVLRQRILILLLIALASALIAMPVIVPTLAVLPEAERMLGDVHAGPGFPPTSMIGLLLPVIAGSDAAISHHVIITTFVGAWILPALLLGIGVVAYRRADADRTLLRVFILTAVTAALLVWLNFGPRAGLYSALHSLPVWSLMRIPFKYFERAVPMLAIAAAIGLELALRHVPPRRYARAALVLAIFALVAWIMRPAHEPLAWLAGSTALATIAAMGMLAHERFVRVLVPLVIIQSIALIAMANSPRQYKLYQLDRDRATRLPVNDSIGRVLPVSEGPAEPLMTRPLARFYSPTLDGYASATGMRFALTSVRIQSFFPTLISGVPRPLPRVLTEHFMRNISVRHLVVAEGDSVARKAVVRAFPAAQITFTQFAQIFHLPFEPERAYFARQQIPGNDAGIHQALYGPAERYTVAVPGDERRRSLAPGVVRELNWQRDRIEARVFVPAATLLVFSTGYSREWIAEVDGRRSFVYPANGMLTGVWVPADSERVTLRIRRWPLLLGFAIAAMGLLLAWFAFRFAANRSLPQ